jgi:hypothetical protein
MRIPVSLAVGEHLSLEPTTHWKVQFSDTQPPSVLLTASIQCGPNPPIFSGREPGATMTHQMDLRVAIELHRQLGELMHSMDWPQRSRAVSK